MADDDKLLDQLTRRQTLIQRLSSGQIKKTRPIIRQLAKDIRGRIASADETEFQQRRLKVLERDIQAMVSEASDQVQGVLDLEDFARDEVEFTEKLLGSHVSVELAQGVSPEVVKAITTQRAFELVSGDKVTKATIPELFQQFSEAAGKDAKRAVQAGVVEGKTTQELAKEVATLVQTRSRRQAEAVIRTSINGIGAAARGEVYRANSDVLDGEVWTSTLDSSTSLRCAGLDQEKFPVGKGPMPPAHYNCLLGDSHVTASSRITNASKRWFDGEVIVIRTASGRELTGTPNHPILTSAGWVAMKDVHKTGDVIACSAGKWVGFSEGDHKDVVPTIHDVTEALFSSRDMGAMPVPVTAKDFHGDCADNQVAVVGANGFLWKDLMAFCRKHVDKLALVNGRSNVACDFPRLGHLAQSLKAVCPAPGGDIGIANKGGDLLRAAGIHTGLLLFPATSQASPAVGYNLGDRAFRVFEPAGDAGHAHAGVMEIEDSVLNKAGDKGFGAAVKDKATASQRGANTLVSSADLERRILEAEAIEGAFVDDVVDSVRRKVACHVYNLETEEGYYVANGIVTHNCRSLRRPSIKPEYRVGRVGERASMDGPVDARTTYGGWLKKQPDAFIEDTLGPERAKLFKSGKVNIHQFVDDQGRSLSLDQLRDRYDLAME